MATLAVVDEKYAKYDIDKCGVVRNVERGTIVRPSTHRDGYLKVLLYDGEGNRRTYQVHRLVAQVFLPNPDNRPIVDHINGNRQDNRAENLRWVTQQQNVESALCQNHLLLSPDDEVVEVYNVKKFCREHNLNDGHVYQVLRGTETSHKGWRKYDG